MLRERAGWAMNRWTEIARLTVAVCLMSGGLALTRPAANAATVNVTPETYNNTLIFEASNQNGRTIYLREGDRGAGWIHMQYYHGWQACGISRRVAEM